MTDRCSSRLIRRVAGTAALTAILTTVTAPAFAASPSPSPSSPFSPAAISRAVAKTVVVSDAAPKKTSETPAVAKAPKQAQGSFIKSKVGALVVAVFAVGTGYAIYSAKEDRIRGLNR
ncbi:MAG: hypothetical protein IT185_00610 [Acidobacteria bacterium]|jgi:hypothetical protein|nr:hypothetical protein [Acidobacteriota bacterium]